MAAEQQTLGQRIAALRLAGGMSQSQLAKAAGVPLGTLKNWEQDQRQPYASAVVTLSAALGVEPGRILDGVNFPTVEAPGRAGRPRKQAAEQPAVEPSAKPRGRPQKVQPATEQPPPAVKSEAPSTGKAKGKKGKAPAAEEPASQPSAQSTQPDAAAGKPATGKGKRKKG